MQKKLLCVVKQKTVSMLKIVQETVIFKKSTSNRLLTLKAPNTTAADDIHKYFFIVFQEKIRLDVSSKSSARQRIHI